MIDHPRVGRSGRVEVARRRNGATSSNPLDMSRWSSCLAFYWTCSVAAGSAGAGSIWDALGLDAFLEGNCSQRSKKFQWTLSREPWVSSFQLATKGCRVPRKGVVPKNEHFSVTPQTLPEWRSSFISATRRRLLLSVLALTTQP